LRRLPTWTAQGHPIARLGIEHIGGSASDSAIATLLERGLIAQNAHQLFVTARTFLDHTGSRNLVNPPEPGAKLSGNDSTHATA
jgi:chromosome segregation and condensation protein ScpB